MKEDKLSELSMQLSVDVLKLTKELRAKHETTISNQISRSATSVCTNIAESKYGQSRTITCGFAANITNRRQTDGRIEAP